MCNLELICTTGYLTEATDRESVLFLLKHSMELTLNFKLKNVKMFGMLSFPVVTDFKCF